MLSFSYYVPGEVISFILMVEEGITWGRGLNFHQDKPESDVERNFLVQDLLESLMLSMSCPRGYSWDKGHKDTLGHNSEPRFPLRCS